jgi:multidrug resistance efflux pump
MPLAREFHWCALTLIAWALPGCGAKSPVPYAGFLDAPVAQVASQVAGRVDDLAVHEGDLVHRGQLLAQLDARQRQALVGQAEANVQQAREALKGAEANLTAVLPTVKGAGADIAQAQAALTEAESTFHRTEQLVAASALTDADFVAARARMLEARARLESLTAMGAATRGRVGAALVAVSMARAGVGTAEAGLAVAQAQLAEAQVLAPFDGLVVQRNLQPGEWAAPGTPVLTLEDSSQLWVRLDIEESRMQGLRLGQEAQVRVLAVPEARFRGHVTEIGAEGDFAVNRDVKRGRPDLRTFLVRVGLDERAPELRPGMTAEVLFAAPLAGPGAGQP